MKILFASSEIVPLAKTGGLADVGNALPKALKSLGHEPMVFMPAYRSVLESGIQTTDLGIPLEIPVGDQLIVGRLL